MRKDRLLRLRPDESEDRRAKQNGGHELTDHRGLTESLSSLPKQAGGEQNDDNCGDESRL